MQQNGIGCVVNQANKPIIWITNLVGSWNIWRLAGRIVAHAWILNIMGLYFKSYTIQA